MRGDRARWLVGVPGAGGLAAVVALSASVLIAAPAVAAEPPAVGDCYDLSDAQVRAGEWWPEVEAVPCTESHTYQVTGTGLLPADVNAFDFAARQCGELDVWTSLRVNTPVSGRVVDPLRFEARSFAVRQPPASYVCGAVVVRQQGRDEPIVEPLRAAVEELSKRARARLRHCSDASDGRRAGAPPVTVACSDRPRWEVTSWVIWTHFYDGYPGRAELRERGRELCGPDRAVSAPTASEWEQGLPRTWCYRKVR